MRKCTKCEKEKTESEFFFKNKATGRLHSYCKDCKRELDRNAYKIPGNKRAEKIRINAIESIKRAKKFIRDIKQKSCCKKCGDGRWYVLDFHHLHGKLDTISVLVAKGPNLKRLQDEIDKCILLCSNCHREEHYFKRMKNMVS